MAGDDDSDDDDGPMMMVPQRPRIAQPDSKNEDSLSPMTAPNKPTIKRSKISDHANSNNMRRQDDREELLGTDSSEESLDLCAYITFHGNAIRLYL
jgi:hypothetical protein